MADEVLRERRGHVEILTINRPEARNAINAAVTAALSAALDDITENPDIWVVVLTGRGDKAFSAGADLKAVAAGKSAGIMTAKHGLAGITKREFAKPLIAAVNGPALAGGFEIMLACDMVVAADHAIFGIPEVTRGLTAGSGGLVRLPKRVPMAIALEMALTGDPIDAPRALALGLINRIVPRDRVLDEALALGDRIAENAPLAVRNSKDVMRRAAEVPESEGWAISEAVTAASFPSADAIEGSLAFAEKRKPVWQGR